MIPVIAFCDGDDHNRDEQTSSDVETETGIGAQEYSGARAPGEGAPNMASGRRRADPTDDVGPSSVRGRVASLSSDDQLRVWNIH